MSSHCAFLLLHLYLNYGGNILYTEASSGVSGKVKGSRLNLVNEVIVKDHHHPGYTVFNVGNSEGDTEFSGEQGYHHHIPKQTSFDSVDDPVASKVFLTSPPELTIRPSPVQDNGHHSKHSGKGHSTVDIDSTSRPVKFEACTKETPTFNVARSNFVTESESTSSNAAIIMSGRVEVPSKTDELKSAVQQESVMPEPSTRITVSPHWKTI